MPEDSATPKPPDADSLENRSFAGVSRLKKTPWRVKFFDRLASQIITVGGIGTIIAVLLVVAVLVTNVWPLLTSSSLSSPASTKLPRQASDTIAFGCDEYQSLVWLLQSDGSICVVDLATGSLIDQIEGPSITGKPSQESDGSKPELDQIRVTAAKSFHPKYDVSDASIQNQGAIVGLSDGTVRVLEISIKTEFADLDSLDESVKTTLLDSNRARQDRKTLTLLPDNLVRLQEVTTANFGNQLAKLDSPPTIVDASRQVTKRGTRIITEVNWAAATETEVHTGKTTSTANRMSRKPKLKSRSASIDSARLTDGKIISLSLNGRGNTVFAGVDSGRLLRLAVDDDETLGLVDWADVSKNSLNLGLPLLGRDTALVGDTEGNLFGAFVARADVDNTDASSERLELVHKINLAGAPMDTLCVSPLSRIAAGATKDGKGGIGFLPTDDKLLDFSIETSTPIRGLQFSPKGDALIAVSDDECLRMEFDPGYPEATFAALFRPLWYEGYESPRHIWQSSAATVSAESKLSMFPLIYGTLKATFYTMLISVPLALMAAIYSSEFMDRKWRAMVKPTIELMASVPSVVLGFIAALVLAPLMRENLAWTLACIIVVPTAYLLVSCLWVLLPVGSMIRLNILRLPLMAAILPIAVWVAIPVANIVENTMFAGDVGAWLSDSSTSAVGGWFLLLLPISILTIVGCSVFLLADFTRTVSLKLAPAPFALFNIGRFVIGAIAVVLLAYIISLIAVMMFGDLRGEILDVYQERNALLVGAILGFAVIPIIYTISEDALQAVPQHLRSASLGCGATPWQTTIRVVVPTAMSGLFSAIMVGFGRAIGETMVVLMAAGNTPIMEINPFSGYRTLSATLATELPEAARGSTHFRTLFLAALLLFLFALVINTAAEFVRIRFRKRAYQL